MNHTCGFIYTKDGSWRNTNCEKRKTYICKRSCEYPYLISTNMHACNHICMYACTDVHTNARLHTRSHAHLHACMPACMHACMHTHIRASTHAHMQTCTNPQNIIKTYSHELSSTSPLTPPPPPPPPPGPSQTNIPLRYACINTVKIRIHKYS